jgi:penicillin amidase
VLAADLPVRKNKTPHSGCSILDGTNTDNDWEKLFVPTKDIPRVINPKKGYIVTANNRIMPENSLFDHGATSTTTTRARRITELIQIGIDKNHKFDFKDMLVIQNDTVDVLAREMVPLVIREAQSIMDSIPSKDY